MTDTPDDAPELTDRQRQLVANLPASTPELATALDVAETTIEGYRERLREKGVPLEYDRDDNEWYIDGSPGWTALAHDSREDSDEGYPTDSDDDRSRGVTPDNADDEPADGPDEPDDADTDVPDLSEAQQQAIVAFPATVKELARAIGGDEHDAHATLDLFREDDVDVRYDGDTGQYYLADERAGQIRSKAHVSPTQKTKRAKNALREEHARLERLGNVDPLVINDWSPDPQKESLIAAIGDVHFGDRYYDDRSRVLYDFDYADFSVDAFAESVIETSRQWHADHEECVLAILGDVATGTRIYEEQQLEVEGLLAEQINRGSQALVRLATTLAEHFETLRIRAVVGNHGFQDASAARGSNTDLTVYKWLEWALADRGIDNVDILYGEKTHWLNFSVRGWNVPMRHGQDTQRHVDETARSEADWRGWLDSHEYDIGLRGHHHVPSQHWVLNRYPVASVPSPVPGGEFADRIGEPDASTPVERPAERKLGYVFGVSEDRRMTDDRIIDAAGVDAEL